ncbi:LysR family transcriptional regulator [Photobacterium profundum]|uniref:LysR family transcriptional regulator n=1 Tax=Photobacterium profundum TaxID=74109 RepID=UPI003D0E3F58
MDLNSLNIFIHVVQQGTFSGASIAMNIPVATVSRRVSELETQLDLLHYMC